MWLGNHGKIPISNWKKVSAVVVELNYIIEMACWNRFNENKKYLLQRYLPIVPDPFFRIRILYTHFSHIIKATLSSFIHFFLNTPSAISVVNTERARLPVFTTYPISHRHSLTTKVSIIPYPACLHTLILPYPTHGKYTTHIWYIYPAYPTPLHPAATYFT